MTTATPLVRRRVSISHYKQAADILGVDVASIRAVVDVEARGSGFDERDRPKILYEKHIMYRVTTGKVRDKLVAAGLATTRWRPGLYPASSDDRYEQLNAARRIAGDAAYKAISMGLPQILGTNHRAAGYKSARSMFDAFSRGIGDHLQAMARFIKANPKMNEALRAKDWAGFAYKYNGPSYKKNRYDTKLAAAYRRHSGTIRNPIPINNYLLDRGDKGPAVKSLQADLIRLGYDVSLDGDFGGLTDQAVRDFQSRHGLKPDGIAGVETLAVIAQRVAAIAEKKAVTKSKPRPKPNPRPTTLDKPKSDPRPVYPPKTKVVIVEPPVIEKSNGDGIIALILVAFAGAVAFASGLFEKISIFIGGL